MEARWLLKDWMILRKDMHTNQQNKDPVSGGVTHCVGYCILLNALTLPTYTWNSCLEQPAGVESAVR